MYQRSKVDDIPDIVFDRAIPDVTRWTQALETLEPEISYDFWPNENLDPNDVKVLVTLRPEKGALQKLNGLELVISLARGVNVLLSENSIPEHIPIVKMTDDTLRDQVTEYIVAAITSHHLRLNEYRELTKSKRWEPLHICAPNEFNIGFLGAGSIGINAAKKVSSLGFRVSVWSRSKKSGLTDIYSFSGDGGLRNMASQSNVLVCALPLTSETYGLIDKTLLQTLPAGSFIVNVGRGECLVEQDLIDEIGRGHISGAMLDVFFEEPLPPSHAFWAMKEITITPHIAGYTIPELRIPFIARVLMDYKNGKISNCVDRKDGF